MSVSEIWDFVNLHVEAGTQNPLFIYDPETLLWFVDFTRVGKTARKMPIQDVLGTIAEILMVFGLHENIREMKPHKLYLKYEEAILKFYLQRSRPDNMRILSPTLKLTGASDFASEKSPKDGVSHTTYAAPAVLEKRRIQMDETRLFLPQVLHDAMGKKY